MKIGNCELISKKQKQQRRFFSTVVSAATGRDNIAVA
jgi:hypothetical protein